MNKHSNWRFFTKPEKWHGGAAHLWCWANLDVSGGVVNSRAGFYTIVAAMRDAQAHGFGGLVEVGNPDLLAEFGDRRQPFPGLRGVTNRDG